VELTIYLPQCYSVRSTLTVRSPPSHLETPVLNEKSTQPVRALALFMSVPLISRQGYCTPVVSWAKPLIISDHLLSFGDVIVYQYSYCMTRIKNGRPQMMGLCGGSITLFPVTAVLMTCSPRRVGLGGGSAEDAVPPNVLTYTSQRAFHTSLLLHSVWDGERTTPWRTCSSYSGWPLHAAATVRG
jgi:hypothetical protein